MLNIPIKFMNKISSDLPHNPDPKQKISNMNAYHLERKYMQERLQ